MLKVILERSSGSSATIEERNIQRMNSDDAVCSTVALIFKKFVAKFSMKTRKWGSTVQILFAPHFSLQIFRRRQRIDRNERVCARFAIERGPSERLFLADQRESANSSLRAICLGPRIIATHSPTILQHEICRSSRIITPPY